MQQVIRVLNAENIETIKTNFYNSLASIGESIQGKKGIPLFTALKREKLDGGPYPGVSLFEAANRIMSDLVILNGVYGLLKNRNFPFSAYTVEFGNENKNGFDIRATYGNETLVGEAFNVAPSFFQIKKSSALKKLRRNGADATYRLLMFNNDATSLGYVPKAEAGLYHVLVDIESDIVHMHPNFSKK